MGQGFSSLSAISLCLCVCVCGVGGRGGGQILFNAPLILSLCVCCVGEGVVIPCSNGDGICITLYNIARLLCKKRDSGIDQQSSGIMCECVQPNEPGRKHIYKSGQTRLALLLFISVT